MLVSNSFAVEVPSLIIVLMVSIHAMNLLLGRQIRSRQKSMSHPRITFCSSRRASDFNLFLASVVSPGMMALILCHGHEHSRASWINLDVNNQLEAVREWDRIIQKFWTGNKMSVLPNSIMGSPFVVLFYRGGEVADGPGAPPKVRRRLISTQHTTHRLPTDATSNAHQRLSVFMLTSMWPTKLGSLPFFARLDW